MQRDAILQIYNRNYNPTLATLFDVAQCPVEIRADGAKIFDDRGESYLDFSSGYGVHSIGHSNPHVQAAVLRQLHTLATVPSQFCSEPVVDLVEKLSRLAPGDLNCTMFAGSGSEAIEMAIRAALLGRPLRKRLVAARNSYHGKTLGALGVMGQSHLRAAFEPLGIDACLVPFGDRDAMAAALDDDVAAVFLEPILGGGYISVPPIGYLSEVRAICNETGTLLVIDEVQTGFGRTGKMFAIEHDNIVPDMLVVSKALTGGCMPFAALLMREGLAEEIDRLHGMDVLNYPSDSNGSPIVCAAASAALDVILQENLPRRAAEIGPYLQQRLRRAAANYPHLVLDVPGRALMTGIRVRNSFVENVLWLQLLRRRVITGLSTNSHTTTPVLRWFPPLTIARDEIDDATDALSDSLQELSRVPRVILDMANRMLPVQFWLPKFFLRSVAGLLAKPCRVATRMS